MEISIVIPCYNHGHFIQDAIDSVESLKGVEYEIIIVDDGSLDSYTINKINELRNTGYNVLSHSNRGLAYTRNRGISSANGKYILPLDADNKIAPEYVYKALDALKNNKADIIYADPIFFGENNLSRQFQTKEFNGYDLFLSNYIDACAIYRKEVWGAVGGYDFNMPYQGHEDWEFWLHAFLKGYKFMHLNERLYFYRIVGGSMIESTISTDSQNQNHSYIIQKHLSDFITAFDKLSIRNKMYLRDESNPLRSSFKYLYRFFHSCIKLK